GRSWLSTWVPGYMTALEAASRKKVRAVPMFPRNSCRKGSERLRRRSWACRLDGKSGRLKCTVSAGRRAAVCLFSIHPLLLSEFERLLGQDFRLLGRRVEPDQMPDLRRLPVSRASVHLLEAHPHSSLTAPLLAPI